MAKISPCYTAPFVLLLLVVQQWTAANSTTHSQSTQDPVLTASQAGLMNVTESAAIEVAVVQEANLLTYPQYEVADRVLGHMQYAILPASILVTLLNMAVFTHRSMQSSTGKYVLGLSSVQLLFLCVDVGSHVMMALVTDTRTAYGYWVYGYYFLSLGFAVTRRGTYVVMSLLSLERLYAVFRPLHARTFLLSRYPASAVTAAYVITAAFHAYQPCMMHIVQTGASPAGQPYYSLAATAFYLGHLDLLDYWSLVAKIGLDFIPLVLLILLNLATLIVLRRHSAQLRQLKTSGNEEVVTRRQRQMTVTIFGATFAFIFLSLPFTLHAIAIVIDPSYHVSGPRANPRIRWFFLMMQTMAYNCILLSSFTDFLSFLLLSSAYRSALLSLLPPLCRRRLHARAAVSEDRQTVLQSLDSVSDPA